MVVVYLGQDVEIGGYLFLGTSSDPDPTDIDGAYLIREFRKIPTEDGNDFERRAVL